MTKNAKTKNAKKMDGTNGKLLKLNTLDLLKTVLIFPNLMSFMTILMTKLIISLVMSRADVA